MNVSQPYPNAPKLGPEQPFDLNTTEESYQLLQTWLPRYADVFQIQPLNRRDPAIFVNDADLLKHILVANHKNYIKGAVFERVKMLLGNGIIVSDGSHWRKQRRMVQPAFSKEMIARISEQIKQCNLRLLSEWQQWPADKHLDISAISNELALEIILRAIFGSDFDDVIMQQGSNPFAILTESAARDMQLVMKFRALSKLVLVIVEQRRAEQAYQDDFLSVFMTGVDKESGTSMSDKEVVDEVMTLIVAGSETSAATMNWVWYLLALHPDVEQKVHAEIDQLQYDNAPTFEQVIELQYLRQVIEEALRLYPPVWLYSRKALQDDQFGDYHIPANADIFISPYFLHRHSRYWPDAETFDPERFNQENSKQRHKFAYIPFSAGPRRCIGDFFGIMEVQMHFAILARHFKMRLHAPQTLELAPEVNLRNKYPFIMQLEKR